MKRFIFVLVLISISAFLFAQDADYILKLDFNDVNQSGAPYKGYAAAYLVNITNIPIPFITNDDYSWNGVITLYSNENLKYDNGINEAVMDNSVFLTNKTFILNPGEKVKLFSYAFNKEQIAKNPYSELWGKIYINRQEKRIKANVGW